MSKQLNKQSNQTTLWRGIYGGIIGALLVVSLFGLVWVGLLNDQHAQLIHSQESMMEFESVITKIVSDTQDAVVSVGNFQQPSDGFSSFSFGEGGLQIEDIDREPVLMGSGSGVIYRIEGEDAYVVTNNHVVEGATSLQVTLADGTDEEAELVGTDQLSDIAVLKINSAHVEKVLEFADSSQVQVGQLALAIGSPIGRDFASSVTQGIISGLDRTLEVDTDGNQQPDWEMTLMQTDAAINPGNSGGALVDSQGKLVGINSSKLAASAIEGMGFAIPSNDVQDIIAQLEENGQVIRPVLGVSTYNLSSFTIETRVENLKLPEDMTDGALVAEIQPGSSAEKAGLEFLDVITAINGEPVQDGQSLKRNLYQYQVGDTITVSLYREGELMDVEVTLEAAMDTTMQGIGEQ